jgi:hypothetical protein
MFGLYMYSGWGYIYRILFVKFIVKARRLNVREIVCENGSSMALTQDCVLCTGIYWKLWFVMVEVRSLVGWLVGWLVGSLVGCLIGWLVGSCVRSSVKTVNIYLVYVF